MCLEVLKKKKEKFGLRFLRLKEREKGITNVFMEKKLTRKLYLVHLEVKIQVITCASCINNENANKKQK